MAYQTTRKLDEQAALKELVRTNDVAKGLKALAFEDPTMLKHYWRFGEWRKERKRNK